LEVRENVVVFLTIGMAMTQWSINWWSKFEIFSKFEGFGPGGGFGLRTNDCHRDDVFCNDSYGIIGQRKKYIYIYDLIWYFPGLKIWTLLKRQTGEWLATDNQETHPDIGWTGRHRKS
jgi:hypothetical protein